MLGDLVLSSIVPVATKYQALLLDSACKMNQVFGKEKAATLGQQTLKTIEQISGYIDNLKADVQAMVEARRKANRIESEKDKAIAYHDTVLPFFDTIRCNVDNLELVVDDEIWPLPKYRELLFIR